MTKQTSLKIGGALKAVHTIHVKIGGALKAIHTGQVKTGGALKEFYSAAANIINLTTATITGIQMTSGTSDAGIRLLNTGQAQKRENGVYSSKASNEWQDPVGWAAASGYEASWASVSGTVTVLGGMTAGSWYNLGTSREMYISNPDADNSDERVIDVSIRPSGGGTTVTARITLQATNTYI